MIAYITRKFGPTAEFEEVDIARPKPLNGQVLLKVKATGLNPLDNILLRNTTEINPDLPAILHGDVAGTIIETGKGVHQFEIGEDVFGYAGGVCGHAGALADYMVAEADLLTFKPNFLSFTQAAAMPYMTIAAWEALFTGCKLKHGDSVLIIDGTSDVGYTALQLAILHGAEVTATARTTEDAKTLTKAGATIISDSSYSKNKSCEFDIVFDTTGNFDLTPAITALKPYGSIAALYSALTPTRIDLKDLYAKNATLYLENTTAALLHNINRKSHCKILTEATKLVEQNKLQLMISTRSYSFSEINEAHKAFEAGNYKGKIVLQND